MGLQNFLKTHSIIITFLFIFILAFFLRIYQLTLVPPSVSIDEISFGYNAYSLQKTGRDEYGVFLPFVLRAYDDYRPALLSYLIIPSIKLFGLNAFSTRFPSVILSLITLIALYRIVLLLFAVTAKMNKAPPKRHKEVSVKVIALCTIFLYAISPWNIYLSRLALDTNAGLTFFSIGFWIFLEYLVNKKLFLLLLTSFFSAIAFYAYNGIKFFIPFFLIMLIIIFYKTLFSKKKDIIIAAILFTILLFPLLLTFLNNANLSRFNTLDLLSQEEPLILQSSSQRLLYENNDFIGKIFDNRRIGIVPIFISNYLINIDPTWVYADDNQHEKYKTPDFGLLYFFELPLFILGLYFIVKENIINKKILSLLICWILFSIIPAAITYDTPSAVRIYTALPAFLIVEGIGFYFLIKWFATLKKSVNILLSSTTFLIIFISFIWFLHAYFVLLPYEFSQDFSYGSADAILYAASHENSYKHIVISNRGDLEFSYIYYLFFTKYNPAIYLQEGGTQSGYFFANHFIGKFAFIEPNLYSSNNDLLKLNSYSLSKNTLYIIDAADLPQDVTFDTSFFRRVNLLKTIRYINSQNAIYIFTPKANLNS